jgi:hypothetical protein
MNTHYKNRYDQFINTINALGPRVIAGYSENHHILPRCMKGTDDPNNLIQLTLREHFLAHWLLWKAYPTYLPIVSAFLQMNEKNSKSGKEFQGRITGRTYEQLKTQTYQLLSEFMTNKVHVKDEHGNVLVMSKEEYANQDRYQFHTTGKIYALDTEISKWVYISSAEYQANKIRYKSRMSLEGFPHGNHNATIGINFSKYQYLDTETNEIIKITKSQARIKNTEYGYKRLKHIQKHQVPCIDQEGKTFSVPLEEYKLGKYKSILTHKFAGKFTVKDQNNGTTRQITQEEYQGEKERYATSTKGKVLARDSAGKNVLVSKEEFAAGDYVGQTAGLTTVFDKVLGQYRQITQDEFETNRANFSGPCSGKVNIINKQTGIRSQIPKSQMDTQLHAYLGDKKHLFLCQNSLTSKNKYVSIYEWELVGSQYIILDTDKFDQVKKLL